MNEEEIKEEDYEYNARMSTFSFAEWECPKCEEKGDDGDIDVQDGLEQLCFEPFNGVTIECGKCKQEYDLAMRVEVTAL